MKVDLVNSTNALRQFKPATYLQLAHTYLSTLDQISEAYGADSTQTEYSGDGVQTYYPEIIGAAERVIYCSVACRYATEAIKRLDPAFSTMNLFPRVICHYGEVIVANIGPWGDRNRKVMGIPLHKVGHIEKGVAAGSIHVTMEAAAQLEMGFRNKYLVAGYQSALSTPPTTLPALLGASTHYLVRWPVMYRDMGLN